MKLKNIIYMNGFIDAFVRLKEQKFPVKVAWKLDKLNEELVAKNEVFTKSRQRLLEEHGKRDKDGELLLSKDGERVELKDEDKFNKDWQELLEIEEEYKFEKVELPEEFEMTTQDIGLLKDILVVK